MHHDHYQCKDYVFEPQHMVHHLSTSTKIEARGAPACIIAFATKQITDFVMSDWANQFQLLQYVGQHFIYPRWSAKRQDHAKAKCMAPSHLNGGIWLKDVGHSASLTAQLVCGLTSHAPIEHYRKWFKVGNQDELCPHCEGGPLETFWYVLFKCLKHPTQPPDMPNFTKATPYWEHFGKFIMDNPTAYAFVDSPAYCQTVMDSTRRVGRWAKATSANVYNWRVKSRACPLGGRKVPPRTIPIGHVLFERGVHGQISHCLEALISAHVNIFVIYKGINPSARGNTCKTGLMFMPVRDQ